MRQLDIHANDQTCDLDIYLQENEADSIWTYLLEAFIGSSIYQWNTDDYEFGRAYFSPKLVVGEKGGPL